MSNPLPNSLALSVINTNDPINSAPLRNDFASVQTAVNQLIACLSGGTAGQRLQAVDGTDVQWVNQITYRKTTAKQVVNSVAETDLLNGEITVAANALGSTGALRLTASGDAINNTGGTVASPRFKVKLGATTIIDTNTIAVVWGTNVGRFGWRIVVEIKNLGATNSQWADIDGKITGGSIASNLFAAFTTGEGIFGSDASNHIFMAGGAASAVDTTVAQVLSLTVTLPTASALEDVTLKNALVEII